MNHKYFNGKFTLILGEEVDKNLLGTLPNNFIVYTITPELTFEKICFDIKKYELDKDEIFNGHIILNNNTDVSFDFLIKLPLDDNSLYCNDFKHTPYFNVDGIPSGDSEIEICYAKDDLLYCGSFVLWILAQRRRPKRTKTLYELCRFHRIRLREI